MHEFQTSNREDRSGWRRHALIRPSWTSCAGPLVGIPRVSDPVCPASPRSFLQHRGNISGQSHQFFSYRRIKLGSGGNSNKLYHDPLQALAHLVWQAGSAGTHPRPRGESTQFGARREASLCLSILLMRQLLEMLRHFHHAISVVAKRHSLCHLYAQGGVATELCCVLLPIRHDHHTATFSHLVGRVAGAGRFKIAPRKTADFAFALIEASTAARIVG